MQKVETPRGPLFVRPGARDRAVIYVHGYNDTAASVAAKADRWTAATDATLIVPEAPSSRSASVNFPSLPELLLAAGCPRAEVVAIGHSGAYRTLLGWLSAPQLREIVLVDALYGGEAAFEAWGRQSGHRIAFVGLGQALAARLGAPWYPAPSHYGALDLIPRFVKESPLLTRASILPLIGAGVGAYLIYRWWLR